MFRIHQILLLGFAAGVLHGQITQLDLRFQSRDVDFSTANATKPFKSGTTFPSVCAVGEMFFKTDGPAGANLYGCTALNSWTLESTSGWGGAGASMASQLGDFLVTRTSSTQLTVGANCSPSTPCNVRFGNQVYSFPNPATVTISAGSVPVYIYVTSAGVLTCASASDTLVGSSCTVATGSAFPATSAPLFTWTATSGAWDTTGGTDFRAFVSATVLTNGAGVNIANTNGVWIPSLDTAYISILGNSIWAQLGVSNTFTAGAKQVFQASATTAGQRCVGSAIPSTLAAGDYGCDLNGKLWFYDGTNLNYEPYIAGSGTTPPSAPAVGFAHYVGGTFVPASSTIPRAISFSIGDPAGNALTVAATTTRYVTVPFACTISAYSLLIDAGTVTVKFWKIASGTAIPTSANSINTSGVGISSGTAIRSTTLTDFTTTVLAANDIIAMNVTALATAKFVYGVLQCDEAN